MKALLIFLFVLAFLFVGCQAEVNEKTGEPSEEEDVLIEEDKADFLFSLLEKSQEEILALFDETPRITKEEKEAGIEIENASYFFYPGENIYFFFSEDKEAIEILLSEGVFLGFEIKETLDEKAVVELFGKPDEKVFFRDRQCLVYYMERGDVLFVKETETEPMHISIFSPPK